MKVAVVGADTGLGSRLIESFHLGGGAFVTAVVARPAQFTRGARFAIDLKVADGLAVDGLARSLAGCSAAVYAMAPDLEHVRRRAATFCRAAAEAGLRRVIYVSSADVHGLNPPDGTDDTKPLHTRHASAYVNTLVAAERTFFAEARALKLSGLVLRPGAIYGPRTEFIRQVTSELLRDRAWLFHRGEGLCPCVYVDNVVAAVRLALKPKAPDGAAFLVLDEETVTWRKFYQAVAQECELSFNAIHCVDDDPEKTAAALAACKVAMADDPLSSGLPELPLANRVERHGGTWKLPAVRGGKLLGLSGLVPFAEGLRRTAAWWRFAHGDFSNAA